MLSDPEFTVPDRATQEKMASEPHSPPAPTWRLVVLPAVIVLVVVVASLLLLRALHEQHDPRELARGMRQRGRRGWQNAYVLSRLLLDPDHEHVRDDVQLCRILKTILVQQNQRARKAADAGQPTDEELIRFRVLLCRMLGEFRLLDGLPALLECASPTSSGKSKADQEAPVRRAAMEAIAVLAANVGPEKIRADTETVEVLVAASRSGNASASVKHDAGVGAAAAFALGVLGGPRATEQLVKLLEDMRPDIRYNAATGLARQRRPEATSVLVEMLDPDRQAAYREQSETARARKRLIVLSNGISAATRLLPAVGPDDRQQLAAALERLRDSKSVASRIRIAAKEALLKLEPRPRSVQN